MQTYNEKELRNLVREIIVNEVLGGATVPEFTDDDDLVETLGADSLEMIEYTLALEDKFGIEIEINSEAEGSNFLTVNKTIEYLRTHHNLMR